MREELQDALLAIKGELMRVTAERDALARHVETLIAPVTREEAQALGYTKTMRETLQAFLDRRQRAGQFKAFE